jgi:predicted MFS family arabinose efflux permease
MLGSEFSPEATARRERVILFCLAAVHFTSIVDFMVVMPLGPQLEKTLGLGPAEFGMIVAAYTYAAGLAGLGATMVLDRFSRRAAFLSIFAGFIVGTFACGLANSYASLLIARFLTGSFGGILGGIAMAIIGDVFPENRRGTATGLLMSAFAIASVAGVPLGLTLGLHYGWQAPFLALAALCLPIFVMAFRALPRLDEHLSHPSTESGLDRFKIMFSHPNHIRAFILMIALTFGAFAVFPYMSPYLVFNVGLKESELPFVYIAGGAMSLFGSPLIGRLSDRYGKLRVFRYVVPVNALLFFTMTILPPIPVLAAVVLAGLLMVSNVGRMVPAMALITSSVEPRMRGGFMGANAAVQHIAAGLGTSAAAMILAQPPEQPIQHYPVVGAIAAVTSLSTMLLAGRLRTASIAPAAESPQIIGEAILATEGGL